MANDINFTSLILSLKSAEQAEQDDAAEQTAYRVHLTRTDGKAIDTETGTLAFSHAYYRSNGKVFTPAAVARKFTKSHGWRGYQVERVETYTFIA